MLKLGVQSLNRLLADLMDQARLEAGHERRQVANFDVASLLKEFCDSTRPLAAERNLFLLANGPSTLMVDGDAGKIQRIVQNLVLNAIKVTETGGVKVTWEAGNNLNVAQWALCVQDTGPGFKRGSASPLERVLKRATRKRTKSSNGMSRPSQDSLQAESAPTLPSQTRLSAGLPAGERHWVVDRQTTVRIARCQSGARIVRRRRHHFSCHLSAPLRGIDQQLGNKSVLDLRRSRQGIHVARAATVTKVSR